MLVFVNASGDVPFLYFCMKKAGKSRKYPVPNIQVHPSTRNSNTLSLLASSDSWSETGYVSENHIEEAVTKFASVMRERWGHTSHPIILLADNLRQHRTEKILELSARNKIILQMFTPNASHYLQPLDNKLFAIFKDQLEIRYRRLCTAASSLGLVVKDPLVSVIPESFTMAFTPLHIRQSWSNVGIWPYQRHLIMERALKYTHKEESQKYTKKVTSPMKAQAFEVARKVNEAARNEVVRSVDKTLYQKVIREKKGGKKKNTATALFEKTGGQQHLLLEHERAEREKKEELKKDQEESKKAREERKRKRRMEEDEKKEERKRQRKEKKEEEMKVLARSTCQIAGCRFKFNEGNVRAQQWYSCSCKSFYVCPSHKLDDLFEQLKKEHSEKCQKE